MPGQPVVRPNPLDALVENFMRTFISTRQLNMEQQRIDVTKDAHEWTQAYNMMTYASEIAKNNPGTTLADLGPGFTPYLNRLMGEEGAARMAGLPVTPETVASVANEWLLEQRETNPDFFNKVIEFGTIRDVTGVEGGKAALDTSEMLVGGRRDAIASIYNKAAEGDPVALDMWHQGARVVMGLEPETVIYNPDGTERGRFSSAASANGTIRMIEALNAAQTGGTDAMVAWAKIAHTDLHELGISQSPIQTMQYLQASITPATDAAGNPILNPETGEPYTQLDQLAASDWDRYGAIHQYFSDKILTMEGAYQIPLLTRPQNEGLRNSLGQLKTIEPIVGKENLFSVGPQIDQQFRDNNPDLPMGVTGGPRRKLGGIPIIGGILGGGPSIKPNEDQAVAPGGNPFVGTPLAPQAGGLPGGANSAERAADALMRGLATPVSLREAGVPKEIINEAIRMRRQRTPNVSSEMSVDPALAERYGWGRTPQEVVDRIRVQLPPAPPNMTTTEADQAAANMPALLDSLAVAESQGRGDYTAIGEPHPRTGAIPLGRYQVMSDNLPSWSQEIVGRLVSNDEFLNSPQLQDQIAKAKLTEYLNRFGNIPDALSSWHSGRPLAQARREGAEDYLNTRTPAYVASIMRDYQRRIGGQR